MTVCELRREKGHIYKIITDEGDCVAVDIDIVSNYSIKAGTRLSREKLEEIKAVSDYERAKSRALWYLDRSDRTEKELFDKLVTAGFEKNACAKVLKRLKELELINDMRYAKRYVGRLVDANTSKKEIYFKLMKKGIPKDIINEAIGETEIDEASQIKSLIEKKYKNKITDKNSVQKVYASLIRKGFSFSAVRLALKNYEEELEYVSEE